MWKTLKYYKKIINTVIENIHDNYVLNLSNYSLDKWLDFDYISGNNRLSTQNNCYIYENSVTKLTNDSIKVNIYNTVLKKQTAKYTFRDLLYNRIKLKTCFNVQIAICGTWRNTNHANDYRLETFDLITAGTLDTVRQQDFALYYNDEYIEVPYPDFGTDGNSPMTEWVAADYTAIYIRDYPLRDFSEYKHIGEVEFEIRAEFTEGNWFLWEGEGLDALQVIITYYTKESGQNMYNSDLNLIAWELQN